MTLYSPTPMLTVNCGEEKHADLVYGDCDFVDYEGRFLFMMKSPPPTRLAGLVRLSPVHGGRRVGFAQPAANPSTDRVQGTGRC